MLKATKTVRNFFYGLAGLLGFFCVAWLISSKAGVDAQPVKYSLEQANYQGLVIPVSDDISTVELNSLDPKQALKLNKEDVSDIDSRDCSEPCNSNLSLFEETIFDEELSLDDKNFDQLQSYTQEFAAYLQKNDSKRQAYVQIALATTDGDKRAFLTEIFKLLPDQQKLAIGETFIDSENWRVRADGVALLADNNVSNLDISNTLIDIFSTEENSYIKGSILSYLENDPRLQGNTEVLHHLDSIIYNGVDSSDRVAALKTKMQLSDQPYDVMPDAVHALQTSEPEFQLAGLVAIDQILAREQEHINNGAYIDRYSIKKDIDRIRNMVVYKGDEERFEYLIKEAKAIYLRYFEHQTLK